MKKLVVILLFITNSAFAQDDFVVIAGGDTLYGKVTFPPPQNLYETVSVKTSDGTEEIRSNRMVFSRAKGENYRSVNYGGKFRIMKEEEPGFLTYYTYRLDNDYTFGARYLYKVSGEGMEVSSLTFRKKLAGFLEECSELSTAIRNKEYSFKQLEEVVNRYNTSCITYDGANYSVEGERKSFNNLAQLQEVLDEILSKLEDGKPIPDELLEQLDQLTQTDVNSSLKELLETVKNSRDN